MAFKMNKVKNPCWDGFEMYGTKKKNGKTVPNCVKSSPKKNYKEGYYNDSPMDKKSCYKMCGPNCTKCK